MSYTGLRIGSPLAIGSKRDWENQFRAWGSPPGEREQARCENTVKEIRAAINASAKLNRRNIRVFVQGSYRNRVNVRQDSDVDIGVECEDVMFSDLPEGKTKADFGITPAEYTYAQFKNEVGEALTEYFGRAAVTRGDKAFDIKATQRQVEADVAPFFQHRRYRSDGGFDRGVELRSDSGGRIINWPEQHYDNGVAKHTRTSQRFKKIVRILKCLRNEMEEKGREAAKPIPSFLIECLVFNAPTRCFGNDKWHDDVMAVLAFLRENTVSDHLCNDWGEVSELKYLFRGSHKWTRQQAHEFIKAAEAYILVG